MRAGLDFAWEERTDLYRLTLTAFLNSYRYRDVLGRAFLDDARRFDLSRFQGGGTRGPRAAITGDPPLEVSDETVEDVLESVQFVTGDRFWRPMIGGIRSITRGPHAQVQMGLLARGAEIVHAAGVPLIIVEGPLYPRSAQFYDTTIREEFLEFVHSLVRRFGVRFVSLEDSGPFGEEDFGDFTHLNGPGALKLTRAMRMAVRRALAERNPSPPSTSQ